MRLRRVASLFAAAAAALLGAGLGAVPAQAAAGSPLGRVVVLGVDGLQWGDVTQGGMPTLYTMAGGSDLASLVTRGPLGSTCPADGWLTLGTGERTTGGVVMQVPAATPTLSKLLTSTKVFCAPLPKPPSVPGPYSIPDYTSYTAANTSYDYNPVLGALETPISDAGGCVAASGAGAMLAAADPNGSVDDYLGAPDQLTRGELSQCALTLVDLGGIYNINVAPKGIAPYLQPVRLFTYASLDAQIATIVGQLPPDTTLVVAGLNDSSFTAHLHVLMVTGKTADGAVFNGSQWLYSTSTRHDGLVQTTDLTPSLLEWAGLSAAQIQAADPQTLGGTAITTGSAQPAAPGAAIVTQAHLDAANLTFTQTNERFITWMAHAITILVWAAGAVFAAVRWLPERYSPGRFAHRRAFLARWRPFLVTAVGVWAVALAAIAPASFLANLTDWSGAGNPNTALFTAIAVIAAVLAAAVLIVCRATRLRSSPLAPAGILSLLTTAVIAVDVATGSHLEAQTPFGLSYTIAGRFYGIGNSAIGVYCAAAMVGSVWVASLFLPSRAAGGIAEHVWPHSLREAIGGWIGRSGAGRMGLTRLPDAPRAARRGALLAVGGVALVAIAACGWPTWGSKFGGTIAMVPGFVLLLFLVAGLRITWRKVLVVGLSGVVVVSALALFNYLQPAGDRSHFSGFVASVLNGTWTSTIHRKIGTNLASINNDWFSRYVPWLLLWCLLAVVLPRLIASRTLTLVYSREPFLRCALWLALITVTIGWFVDDSGILVPKMALFFAVPVGVLAVARAVRPDAEDTATGPSPAAGAGSVSGAPVEVGAQDERSGTDQAGLLA